VAPDTYAVLVDTTETNYVFEKDARYTVLYVDDVSQANGRAVKVILDEPTQVLDELPMDSGLVRFVQVSNHDPANLSRVMLRNITAACKTCAMTNMLYEPLEYLGSTTELFPIQHGLVFDVARPQQLNTERGAGRIKYWGKEYSYATVFIVRDPELPADGAAPPVKLVVACIDSGRDPNILILYAVLILVALAVAFTLLELYVCKSSTTETPSPEEDPLIKRSESGRTKIKASRSVVVGPTSMIREPLLESGANSPAPSTSAYSPSHFGLATPTTTGNYTPLDDTPTTLADAPTTPQTPKVTRTNSIADEKTRRTGSTASKSTLAKPCESINSPSVRGVNSNAQGSAGAKSLTAALNVSTKERLVSLDTFRGLTLTLMIFVNFGGGGFWFFDHHPWNGTTLADYIFPWFLFMMGVSMAISYKSTRKLPTAQQLLRLGQRSLTLALIGLFLNNFARYKTFRYPGVLQRFGISYFFVSLIMLLPSSAPCCGSQQEGSSTSSPQQGGGGANVATTKDLAPSAATDPAELALYRDVRASALSLQTRPIGVADLESGISGTPQTHPTAANVTSSRPGTPTELAVSARSQSAFATNYVRISEAVHPGKEAEAPTSSLVDLGSTLCTAFVSILNDLIRYRLQWFLVALLAFIWLAVSLWLPVPGCPKGYFGPGGPLVENGRFKDAPRGCTGGAAGYIDQVVFGLNHIYKTPTPQEVYLTGPFDPEGLLGVLTSIVMVYLGLAMGRVLVDYKTHAERISRWSLWIVILAFSTLASLGFRFDFDVPVNPVNKNLWTLSFILLTATTGLIMLTIMYVLVDVFRIYSGRPFYFMGMNSILMFVIHILFQTYFPLSWKIYGEATHELLLYMNLQGDIILIVLSYYLFRNKIFLKV